MSSLEKLFGQLTSRDLRSPHPRPRKVVHNIFAHTTHRQINLMLVKLHVNKELCTMASTTMRLFHRELHGRATSRIDDDSVENAWRLRHGVFSRVLRMQVPFITGWKVGLFPHTPCFTWYEMRTTPGYLDMFLECGELTECDDFEEENYAMTAVPIKPVRRLFPGVKVPKTEFTHDCAFEYVKWFDAVPRSYPSRGLYELLEELARKYDRYGLGALDPRVHPPRTLSRCEPNWPQCVKCKRDVAEDIMLYADPMSSYVKLTTFAGMVSGDAPMEYVKAYYADGWKPLIVHATFRVPLVVAVDMNDYVAWALETQVVPELRSWARDTYWRFFIQLGDKWVYRDRVWVVEIGFYGEYTVRMLHAWDEDEGFVEEV